MRICFIANEIFAFGKYGGFGRASRIIGSQLVRRGHEVFAVVPRRGNQQRYETLDGIRVYGYHMTNPFTAIPLLKEANADIYHSEEPSLMTFIAQVVMPQRKHVITFRDTRDNNDWWIEFKKPSISKLQVLKNILFEDSLFTQIGVWRADGSGVAARFLSEKAKKKYRLKSLPELLPTPVFIPDQVTKSKTPLVVFVSRLDRRKRVDRFLQLARNFPDIKFLMMGRGQDERYIRQLQEEYGSLPNVEKLDFINQFDGSSFTDTLGASWILVNTSEREGLPNSFIEGAAHRCAILSSVDPDQFASRFGYCASDDDFEKGLSSLLTDNRWQAMGKLGYEYVKSTYAMDIAIDKHETLYNKLFNKGIHPLHE